MLKTTFLSDNTEQRYDNKKQLHISFYFNQMKCS